MDKHLHIVSLDVPYPADYGGVIDIFYKIKSLHAVGIKIHLHCFTKGRAEQPKLHKYCSSVHYYKRKKQQTFLNPLLPYIVSSRNNPELLENLKNNAYPVLLEGIHCSYFLHNGQLENRKVFLRLHNTEHIYYAYLAKHEKDFLKKLYFEIESKRLKKYEKEIANKCILLAISEADKDLFINKMAAKNVKLLPAFTAFEEIKENVGTVAMPLLIAGKNPSLLLINKIKETANCTLVPNPAEAELQKLIQEAQVNILPSANATGVKLKLLNALFNGRHCLVNEAAVPGTNLAELYHIAASPKDYKHLLKALSVQNFTPEEIHQRKNILLKEYNNKENALLLSSWLC